MHHTQLSSHAARELEAAGISTGPEMPARISEAVMALASALEGSGLEGAPAALAADLFWKLANGMNLSPLLDTESDWEDVTHLGDGPMLRHRRCPDLHRTADGVARYSRALVFRGADGSTWSGSCWVDREMTWRVDSGLEVAAFPFMPRTFVVDVERRPVSENGVDDFLSDPSQVAAAAASGAYRVPRVHRREKDI
jgi:hypothetical protein